MNEHSDFKEQSEPLNDLSTLSSPDDTHTCRCKKNTLLKKILAVVLLVLLLFLWLVVTVLSFERNSIQIDTCKSIASQQAATANQKDLQCKLTYKANFSEELTEEQCVVKEGDMKEITDKTIEGVQCDGTGYWILNQCICTASKNFGNNSSCQFWKDRHFKCSEQREIFQSDCQVGQCTCKSDDSYWYEMSCDCEEGRFGNFCEIEEKSVSLLCDATLMSLNDANQTIPNCDCETPRPEKCVHWNHGTQYLCGLETNAVRLNSLQECNPCNTATNPQRLTDGCSTDVSAIFKALLIAILITSSITIAFYVGFVPPTSMLQPFWRNLGGASTILYLFFPIVPIIKYSAISFVLGCSIVSMIFSVMLAIIITCKRHSENISRGINRRNDIQ